MGTRKSVLKNLGAGTIIQLSNVIIRLIQVPILISFLGIKEYGQWLILYSLPMLFSMANFGFASVAANDIALLSAAKKHERAQTVYSTAFGLLNIISITGIIITIFVIPIFNWTEFIEIENSREQELIISAIFLGISVFIGMPAATWDGKLRAVEKAHLAIFINGTKPWINFICLILTLFFTKRFDLLALSILISSVLYVIIYFRVSIYHCPKLIFKRCYFNSNYIKPLLINGISFQTLAIGNALQNQGMLFIIQGILGPVQVAIYSTARTAVNSMIQAMGLINQITWPEFSILIGKGHFAKASRLHHLGSLASYSLSIIGFFFLLLLGPFMIKLWTNGNIIISRNLFFFFIIIVPLVASYATSSVVLAACNQIKVQAQLFLVGTTLNLLLCWIFTPLYGLAGSAASASAVYIISFHYVTNRAIKLTGDTVKGFISGIFKELMLLWNSLKKGGFIKLNLHP